MIPKIEARAYYPYLGDFTHTYNGQTFYFDFVNESDIPQDIQIDSSIFDSVIQAELSMDSMRIAQQGYIISSLSNYTADIASLIYNFSLSAIDAIYQGLIDQEHSSLKWSVTYNGSVGTNRYSWTFYCPLGSQDIILGSDGLLPHPSDHTYTSHNDTIIGDIIDDQVIDDNVYIPSGHGVEWNQLNPPYIVGKDLYFTCYYSDRTVTYKYIDFTETFMVYGYWRNNRSYFGFADSKISSSSNVKPIYNLDNSVFWTPNNSRSFEGTYQGNTYTGYISYFLFDDIQFSNWQSCNFPGYRINDYTSSVIGTITGNMRGWYQQAMVSGQTDLIFLKSSPVSPVSNPDDIVIPIDTPLPVDPIITWPDDNLPDDDPDGEPVDVDPYDPVPIDPVIPLPPIPTVVSGNDDLWPDLNDYFNTEDNIIDFTFPAVNVEFPDLSILLGNFVNSFTWVSTIITALFNGSDFSVLFSVLAFFFIAAAVLGIYKWWK